MYILLFIYTYNKTDDDHSDEMKTKQVYGPNLFQAMSDFQFYTDKA